MRFLAHYRLLTLVKIKGAHKHLKGALPFNAIPNQEWPAREKGASLDMPVISFLN